MGTPSDKPCRGCGRYDLHKMCPAWGTRYYMSGIVFTSELEEATKEERAANRAAAEKRYKELWDQGIDPSGLS